MEHMEKGQDVRTNYSINDNNYKCMISTDKMP
jgi:hypothetical protein